jgi:succinyl-CoA synthetase beta subunit
VDNFSGRNRRADEVAKRIAAAVAYGPKSKSELVMWLRLKGLRVHGFSTVLVAARINAHERERKNEKIVKALVGNVNGRV